ncbi:hypothetical protein OV203_46995 [Nannocystis sp. ILAH1]|uniref:hypothetical protein n=1 Tax=unclassified Nannocystis TaxID=2627009 RepID=UPI002270B7F4|nr:MULTISPECIES: hypothetical protein [unclassified Nannocystis]MCY0994764.1 hypothetical protein [Nannocystis sp. ILAH1]MCY1065369.1 hypothetical protein [Nannocystis sp. RBIL2]
MMLQAGLAQALTSFVLTLGLTAVLERLFALSSDKNVGCVVAAGGTTTLGALVTAGAHWFAGTPQIALTIGPSVVLGAFVFSIYAWRLRREPPRAPGAPSPVSKSGTSNSGP